MGRWCEKLICVAYETCGAMLILPATWRLVMFAALVVVLCICCAGLGSGCLIRQSCVFIWDQSTYACVFGMNRDFESTGCTSVPCMFPKFLKMVENI